ncbi:hypothetical protein HBJ58_10920 [Halomonas desiderata]|uniref:hypothetical protein n=1 Tax=Billgrantia desiderata TaxID=52021 RepID=UPI001748CC03|nr:hypothetical protein [Halomonas desiderata]
MMATTYEPRDRFNRVTNDYREMRNQLESAHGQLARLKQQRAATLQSSREAGERWRQLFRDAGGKAGKEVRELQTEEHSLAAEVEQLDELIAELEPRVAELRHWAQELRAQHVTRLHEARRDMAAQRLAAALDSVFAKPEGQELLAALAQRADSVQREVLEDHVFMGTIGFDGHEAAKPGFMAMISGHDREVIANQVEKRKRALVADVVMQRLQALGTEHPQFDEDLAAPLPLMACER